ncbi:MAG: hypothetical protein RR988_05615 [Clostridia bacterium]
MKKLKWDLTEIFNTLDDAYIEYVELEKRCIKFLDKKRKIVGQENIKKHIDELNELLVRMEKLHMYFSLSTDLDKETTDKFEEDIYYIYDLMLVMQAYTKEQLVKHNKKNLDVYIEQMPEYRLILEDAKREAILGKQNTQQELDFKTAYEQTFNKYFKEPTQTISADLTDDEAFKQQSIYFLQAYKKIEKYIVKMAKIYSNTLAIMAKQSGCKSSLEMFSVQDEISIKALNNVLDMTRSKKATEGIVELMNTTFETDVKTYEMFQTYIEAISEYEVDKQEVYKCVVAALSILGDDYVEQLNSAYIDNWVNDVEGMLGGNCQSIYCMHPYIQISLDQGINSIFTLAHELGHGVYENMKKGNTKYLNMARLNLATEIPSMVNELLVYENLFKHSNSEEKDRFKYLYVVRLYTNLIYEGVMANLEKSIIENGSKDISKRYFNLLNNAYAGSIQIDPLNMYEWICIPDIYNNMYSYRYVLGTVVAINIVQRIVSKEEGFKEKYLAYLDADNSVNPEKLLKDLLDIDLTSKALVEEAYEYLENVIYN